MPLLSNQVRQQLLSAAESADRELDWPEASWEALRVAGVLGWSIPREYGGTGLSGVALLSGIEEIAAACLTTAFALSQRESAIRQLLKGPVLRVTQAALMVAKGVGFVAPHPVQRWARQAQFFLVWSCPRPVADGVLEKLASD